MIDVGEIASLQRDFRHVDQLPHAVKGEFLPRPDVEPTLAAVPVAVENHGVTFGHVQVAIRIKAGRDIEGSPVQRFSERRRHQQREEKRRDLSMHRRSLRPCQNRRMSDPLVTISMYRLESEAFLAKGALEAAGIDAVLVGQYSASNLPHVSFSGGYSLRVAAEDAEHLTSFCAAPILYFSLNVPVKSGLRSLFGFGNSGSLPKAA